MIGATVAPTRGLRMRKYCLRLMLPLIGLFFCPSLLAADNPAWNNLKQLSPGQQVRVLLTSNKSVKGPFQSVTDDALIVRAKGTDQTISRSNVQQVSARRPGRRGHHALVGAAIGGAAGLGIGVAIYHADQCSKPPCIVGPSGADIAIPTVVSALIGAGIGALIPGGKWQEVYP